MDHPMAADQSLINQTSPAFFGLIIIDAHMPVTPVEVNAARTTAERLAVD
jgi:hypothetical protein